MQTVEAVYRHFQTNSWIRPVPFGEVRGIREAAVNAVQYLCISSPHFLGPTIHGGIWAFQGAAEVGSNKLFVACLLGCSWCSSLHLSPRLILPSSILHLHCHTHSYLLPILSVLPFNLLATACQDVKMDCLSLP